MQHSTTLQKNNNKKAVVAKNYAAIKQFNAEINLCTTKTMMCNDVQKDSETCAEAGINKVYKPYVIICH